VPADPKEGERKASLTKCSRTLKEKVLDIVTAFWEDQEVKELSFNFRVIRGKERVINEIPPFPIEKSVRRFIFITKGNLQHRSLPGSKSWERDKRGQARVG